MCTMGANCARARFACLVRMFVSHRMETPPISAVVFAAYGLTGSYARGVCADVSMKPN